MVIYTRDVISVGLQTLVSSGLAARLLNSSVMKPVSFRLHPLELHRYLIK
jgi:hypothetical protein